MEDLLHVDQLIHDFRLADVPRNAVEYEDVDVRLEFVRFHGRIDGRLPELNGDVVRNELASAGIFEKRLTDPGARVHRAKNIAARTMKKARNTAEGAALCSFAAAGRAKEKIGLVFHGR